MIRRYNPEPAFGDFGALVQRLLGDAAGETQTRGGSGAQWYPATNIYELEDRFVVEMETPGMTVKEIKVHFKDGALSIAGTRKVEEVPAGSRCHRRERTEGRFERNFGFGGSVDPEKIRARANDGVLSIELPKREESKPREIEIRES